MPAPALSSPLCVSSVFAHRLRVARLTLDGSLDPGPENLYVTDSLISIASKGMLEAGTELVQKNGGGGICVQVSEDDVTKRYDLAMTLCQLDAELIEMLTGARVISVGGVVVGLQYPRIADIKPAVCIEAWSEARTGSQQASFAGALLYFRHVWPYVKWTIGDYTINDGVLNVPLNGKATENDNMTLGPLADFPVAIDSAQAFFLDDDMPDSVCGYQAFSALGSS